MADYYVHFGVTLPIPADPALAARIPEWVKTHLDMKEMMYEGAGDFWDYEEIQEEGYDCEFTRYDNYPRGIAPPIPTVWISSGDGEGSTSSAANLIQRYLDDFEIEGGVVMLYAYTCFKPRVNESGGGAVLVTRDEQHWFDPEKEALDLAQGAGIEILN